MTGYDLREELEEIGVSKQFLGRVPYIVHMDRLSRAQLRQILVRAADEADIHFDGGDTADAFDFLFLKYT